MRTIMFVKVNENQMFGKNRKLYETEVLPLDLVNSLQESGYNLKFIRIEDDGDLSMKAFGGEISIDKLNEIFYDIYSTLKSIDLEFEKNNVSVTIYPPNRILLSSDDKDDELITILNSEKKTKQL